MNQLYKIYSINKKASRTHVISALDFYRDYFIKTKAVPNTQEAAEVLESMIVHIFKKNHTFKYILIGMEAAGFYGVHLANYISVSDLLAPKWDAFPLRRIYPLLFPYLRAFQHRYGGLHQDQAHRKSNQVPLWPLRVDFQTKR